MNKYKLTKFKLKDKKDNIPYTVTKLTPKNNKKLNYLKSVNELLDNIEIPENKEIRLCALLGVGWRGTGGHFSSDIEQLRKNIYLPKVYAQDGNVQEYLNSLQIKKYKILVREKRMRF